MQLIRERARYVLALLITRAIVLLMISYSAFSQTESRLDQVHPPDGAIPALNPETPSFHAASVGEAPVACEDSGNPSQPESRGFVRRGATRLLRDQKELYLAPFQRSNFKWDAIVLGGTGALLATDRRIERHLPGGNVDIYGNFSNVVLGGTAAALALAWGYGIKTHNEHLKETGLLEVEALVNTFLIYTPMQFAAGRQRPGEGNGYGDFGRHHNIDTSFPAGHPMFTIAMAASSLMNSQAVGEGPGVWRSSGGNGRSPSRSRPLVVGCLCRLSTRLLYWLPYIPLTLQSEIRRGLPFSPLELATFS